MLSICKLFITLMLTIHAEGLVLGEFTGIGELDVDVPAMNYAVRRSDCEVAVNVDYNPTNRILSYSYGYLCLSESSNVVNTPSNDYPFYAVVDQANDIWSLDSRGNRIAKIGKKNGNQFDVLLETVETISIYWKASQDSVLSEYCEVPHFENVQLKKTLSYSFTLNGSTLFYSRRAEKEALPFVDSNGCFYRGHSGLMKYKEYYQLNASLKK